MAATRSCWRLAPGVYAFYAHLQPGSIRVQVGETVTTGQVLGLLGNTGNSTAPHLHFQLADGPDVLTATSLPFVLDHWTLAGTIDPASTPSDVRVAGTPAAANGDLAARPDRGRLPVKAVSRLCLVPKPQPGQFSGDGRSC